MKRNQKPKRISAEEFDRKFDNGEDMTPYLDMKSAKISLPAFHRINIDVPGEILVKLDKEADRIGVTRTSLIKLWIAERVDKLAG